MPTRNQNIGKLVQRGALLFSRAVPVPAPTLIGAVGAAIVTKLLDLRDQRVSEVLSYELEISHIPYIEPDRNALLHFYTSNLAYRELAPEFGPEIESADFAAMLRWYPYLYQALVLRRQIPWLLFQKEIRQKAFRQMAVQYETLATGFPAIYTDERLKVELDGFGAELAVLIMEAYDAARPELETDKNEFAFDLIDFLRDIATV